MNQYLFTDLYDQLEKGQGGARACPKGSICSDGFGERKCMICPLLSCACATAAYRRPCSRRWER